MASIRTLPPQDQRVESGPIQFGTDWPGTFIRGDSAGWYAILLGRLLDEASRESSGASPIDVATLRGLQGLLGGAVQGPAAGFAALPAATIGEALTAAGVRVANIDYTNYRGERGLRSIVPMFTSFGSTEFHPEPQWLLQAFDVEKRAERTFAMRDIHSFDAKGAD